MNKEYFTLNSQVVNLIHDLKLQFPNDSLKISDVVDDEGHQYIDIVQEGGGVLGIALLGYTYVLEKMGIRFLNVGGTSAGAINALLLAASGKPEEAKTEKIIEVIAKKNIADFMDGDEDALEFIQTILSKEPSKLELLFHGLQVIDNFSQDLGLNLGESFLNWLTEVLKDFEVHDTAKLERRMNELSPTIQFRKDSKDFHSFEGRKISAELAIIAAELTTETKVIFPRMRNLFFKNIDEPNPAKYVRASMSIPLFFKPYELTNLPADENAIIRWNRIGKHRGAIPEKAIFVDGGIMSNFPIDIFHLKGSIPSRPTFGVKLGLERVKTNHINNVGDLLYACFDSARNLRDFEFIKENMDFQRLVAYVDIQDQNWLDFNISDEKKLDLFIAGAKEAKDFLQKFDWEGYKKIRKTIKKTDYSPKILEGLQKSLTEIIDEKGQSTTTNDINALKDRLFYLGKTKSLRALWIDDNPKLVEKERALLRKLGVHSTLVLSTQAAKNFIENNTDEIDFIISDISRNENYTEGVDFTKQLYAINPNYNRKVIFYITDLDISRGVPAYAFGITNSAVELIQLVIDLAQRKDGE
ncbi:MAG: patatin-like phospholipase family protein [Saprospiraceae bacterium]